MAQKQEPLAIEWTETAELQFFEMLNYWTERNQSTTYAEKLIEATWKRTEQIAKNPYSSIQTSFPDTRRVAMGHFSIYYKVTQTKIIITAFWDNRQNPQKLIDLLSSDQ